MDYKVYTLVERPELASHFDDLHEIGWPEFMLYDETAEQYFLQLKEVFPQYQFCLMDDHGSVFACCNAIPFYWDGTVDGLPTGWNRVLSILNSEVKESAGSWCWP
jgi:hypothetical protein